MRSGDCYYPVECKFYVPGIAKAKCGNLVVLPPQRIRAAFRNQLRIEQLWPSSSVCLLPTFPSSWRTLKHANSTREIGSRTETKDCPYWAGIETLTVPLASEAVRDMIPPCFRETA